MCNHLSCVKAWLVFTLALKNYNYFLVTWRVAAPCIIKVRLPRQHHILVSACVFMIR